MSLPKYPEYKSCKYAALAAIPVHWEPSPLKRVVALVESGVSVNSVDEPAGPDAIGVLKTSCVYDGSFNRSENKAVVAEELDRVACPVKAGTLIVSRMNTPALVGAAGLVEESADNLFLPDRLWQVHFSGAIPKFAHYWTASPSYRAQVQMACAGTSASMQNLSQDEFLRFVLPLPPQDEQTAIAAFLDRETAKIDALIAEQEKLIALLAEKRQATISHAVTRGLNPDAPLRDSGVAWLGEVPEHWEVVRLKHPLAVLTDFTANGSFASLAENVDYLAEGYSRLVRLTDLRENLKNDGIYVSEDAHKFLSKSELFGGEVLIANVGAYAGFACLMPVTEQKSTLGPNMYLMRFDERVASNAYINLCLSSHSLREQLVVAATSTAQPKLNKDDVKGCFLALPPINEQTEILALVLNELALMDGLVEMASHGISLLKERRSALIAAAVTGQIDVRGAITRKEPA